MLIHYIYRTRDSFGNKVKGHESRCYALHQAFERLGYEMCYRASDADVIVFDGISPLHVDRSIAIVNMVDTPRMDIFPHHINVSPSFYRNGVLDLSGPHYCIIRDELSSFPRASAPNVLAIPGGNYESFWEQVDGRIVDICLDNGYELKRLFAEDRDTATDTIINADVVICPASVAALEAASIGKPLLLVKTAEDQESNYTGLIESFCGLPYSGNALEFMLQDDIARVTFGENGRRTVNINGKDLIARYVDEKVKEWIL